MVSFISKLSVTFIISWLSKMEKTVKPSVSLAILRLFV